ncbi:transcriptional activator RfaH [Pusillimonas sp. TS35]|uniref:transcription termination/antitermination protein NusG n=1 Tax=Paracandidimonas lactea TaxID=2895524 RepID=UPI00136961AB|nr:transcription termination/antitermination NusG family protein [Paracandidimonas lactea]MYN13588.1 transcriptional activator RfaH [Pusillimonas sp. TS35]
MRNLTLIGQAAAQTPQNRSVDLPTTTPGDWFVAYTHARQESVALANLERQGYEAYLPLYPMIPRRGIAPATHAYEPMFSRYLFFRPASPRQSIRPVHSTRGVLSILSFGGNYAQVQSVLIDAIRARETQLKTLPNSAHLPAPGTRVRISHYDAAGLEGLEGLVQVSSAQRVIVLMSLLGRQTRVKLSPHMVQVA